MARTIDLRRERREEYAPARKPHVVRVMRGRYLAVDGQGAPEGDGFRRAVHALYAMAHVLQAAARAAGRGFKLMPLEAQWWGEAPGGDFTREPRETWRYKVMMRVPDHVGDRQLAAARAALEASGRGEGVEAVELERFAEGRCIQALHVGPYAREGETVARMAAEAAALGLGFAGAHHEVYLSDPRRTPPERLRTLLRHPVRRATARA
ncbi:GyrI-like domain-containing protein [Anaeromyxobacter diazotrophicus]|uniref:Transcriptional regulator n=1 Tax=Anaeromyxobacter diazotrophicus TaxID=2590199 RepID=A0A7I9VJY8_9BACT|nr:GyrI-like domain-containing protein [Anaeromyxobacter diazotrophicus]GEJ56317.1 transcriptional regulator [Anaeromyxobacter diazotrophicus]